MEVRLLTRWNGFLPGHIVSVSDDRAEMLEREEIGKIIERPEPEVVAEKPKPKKK